MACQETTDVGYDVTVIGEYSPQLNCSICTFIIKEATYGCQSHTFCQACIMKHVEYTIRENDLFGDEDIVKCPGGCDETITHTKLPPNFFADRMINTLKTKCSNEFCPWQGDLLDLVQVHQTNCSYIKKACQTNGCVEWFLEKDALQHEENCLYQINQCCFCHEDIIRIDKEKHELVCLAEEISCEYLFIGCNTRFCRKDANLHEVDFQSRHMRLMYENINKKLSESNDEIKNLKHQNAKLFERFVELETSSNKEICDLKEQLMNITTKSVDDGEVDYVKSKFSNQIQLTTTKINSLKKKLNETPHLNPNVFLINNDSVVHVIHSSYSGNDSFHIHKFAECYQESRFDYVIIHMGLIEYTDLFNEILGEVPYHLYEYKDPARHLYWFCFPLELENIQDFQITIPDKFNLSVINKEILVAMESVERITLFSGYCQIELKNKVKLNFRQSYQRLTRFSFNKGYSCLLMEKLPDT